MHITRISLKNFTAFKSIVICPSPGINAFIGTNGTGKTHIMKVAYAACDISKTKKDFAQKLIDVFLPSRRALGRLVKRQQGSIKGYAEISRNELKLRISFSNHSIKPTSAKIEGIQQWISHPIESVYIPVKEMLANAPGFRALYSQREIHFEEIYSDIIDRAYLPIRRGPIDKDRKQLLNELQKTMNGKIKVKNEECFLKNRYGELEFILLAEGIRKLGLLWLLIQNGTLLRGSILFWDEPETNLNPKLFGPLIEILLRLQRMGVQIFLATHDYVILKELDLRKKSGDKVLFHSLYRNERSDEIQCSSTEKFLEIHPNAIADTFTELYNREIARIVNKQAPK